MDKIMIVDDDHTMVSLLQLLFEMDGFEVATFSHRDTIVEDIRTANPDIVLMDVFISSVDGLDLLADLRSSGDLGQLKVVMTSGMDLEDKCMNAGADGFILKPYPPDELMTLIGSLLPHRESSQFVD